MHKVCLLLTAVIQVNLGQAVPALIFLLIFSDKSKVREVVNISVFLCTVIFFIMLSY